MPLRWSNDVQKAVEASNNQVHQDKDSESWHV